MQDSTSQQISHKWYTKWWFWLLAIFGVLFLTRFFSKSGGLRSVFTGRQSGDGGAAGLGFKFGEMKPLLDHSGGKSFQALKVDEHTVNSFKTPEFRTKLNADITERSEKYRIAAAALADQASVSRQAATNYLGLIDYMTGFKAPDRLFTLYGKAIERVDKTFESVSKTIADVIKNNAKLHEKLITDHGICTSYTISPRIRKYSDQSQRELHSQTAFSAGTRGLLDSIIGVGAEWGQETLDITKTDISEVNMSFDIVCDGKKVPAETLEDADLLHKEAIVTLSRHLLSVAKGYPTVSQYFGISETDLATLAKTLQDAQNG